MAEKAIVTHSASGLVKPEAFQVMTAISRDRSSNQSVKISRVLNGDRIHCTDVLFFLSRPAVSYLEWRVKPLHALNGARPLSLLLHTTTYLRPHPAGPDGDTCMHLQPRP